MFQLTALYEITATWNLIEGVIWREFSCKSCYLEIELKQDWNRGLTWNDFVNKYIRLLNY